MILERFFGGATNNDKKNISAAAKFVRQAKTLTEALTLQERAHKELLDAARHGSESADGNGEAFYAALEKKEAIDRRVKELREKENKV